MAVKHDMRSSTGRNIEYLTNIVGMDPWICSYNYVKTKVTEHSTVKIPRGEEWVIEAVSELLLERQSMEDTDNVDKGEMENIVDTLNILSSE